MSSPSFLFAMLHPNGSLSFQVDKYPYLHVFNMEEILMEPLKVVWQEEFPTIKSALQRRKQVLRMNKARRLKLVTKANPNLIDILKPRPVLARPTGLDFPEFGDASGGVAAKVPRPPIRPLVASDAKDWPAEYVSERTTLTCS